MAVMRAATLSASARPGSCSLAGTSRTSWTGRIERWVKGSKARMVSISLSNSSIRRGRSAVAGKRSRMPPRWLNEPGDSTTGSFRYPRSSHWARRSLTRTWSPTLRRPGSPGPEAVPETRLGASVYSRAEPTEHTTRGSSEGVSPRPLAPARLARADRRWLLVLASTASRS